MRKFSQRQNLVEPGTVHLSVRFEKIPVDFTRFVEWSQFCKWSEKEYDENEARKLCPSFSVNKMFFVNM